MKILQNFSNKKHITDFSLFDIMAWFVGLHQFKKLGYSIKLYCKTSDIEFLKYWHLYDFYDEIDTNFLDNIDTDKRYQRINHTNFWSAIKLFCIEHEFLISKEEFLYSDTDIILNGIISLDNADLFVWGGEDASIYGSWSALSTPVNYQFPDYFKGESKVFNCGFLYFKKQEYFTEYFTEYLKFVMDNPCILTKAPFGLSDYNARNVWACNAEQRILFEIATNKNNWEIYLFTAMPPDDFPIGFDYGGIHYYCLKSMLREIISLSDEAALYWLNIFSSQSKLLLSEIEQIDTTLFNMLIKNELLSDLYYKNILLEEYI